MKKNKPYAYVFASIAYGYGHVNILVHDLFSYNGPRLKIGCQTGGQHEKSYAWEYGLANDYSVIGEEDCHQGYLLLRRMNKVLAQQRDEFGPPATYAEFVIRALHAARIKDVYLNTDKGGRLSGNEGIKGLPLLDSRKHADVIRAEITALEDGLLAATRMGGF